MMSRRLRLLFVVVVVATIGVWLLWLADGAARQDRVTPASWPAGVDTTKPSIAERATAKTAPYAGALPPVVSPNRAEAVPPEAPAEVSPAPDPMLLERPLLDTALADVEDGLEDRALVIPVQGVGADELVDTYTAARSEGRQHNAIDIMAPGGTPVVAVASGTVIKLFTSERGGLTLYQLDPDGRTCYYYAHLAGYAAGIEEGKVVRQGELIGYVGDTGNAGPGNTHLHFEITLLENPARFWSGTPVNPYPLLKKAKG